MQPWRRRQGLTLADSYWKLQMRIGVASKSESGAAAGTRKGSRRLSLWGRISILDVCKRTLCSD